MFSIRFFLCINKNKHIYYLFRVYFIILQLFFLQLSHTINLIMSEILQFLRNLNEKKKIDPPRSVNFCQLTYRRQKFAEFDRQALHFDFHIIELIHIFGFNVQ